MFLSKKQFLEKIIDTERTHVKIPHNAATVTVPAVQKKINLHSMICLLHIVLFLK